MTVTSLETSRALYEALGWEDTDYVYYANGGQYSGSVYHRGDVFNKTDNIPAYDLEFILDRLIGYDPSIYYSNQWQTWIASAHDSKYQGKDDSNAAEAAGLLALRLAEAGVIGKEGV